MYITQINKPEGSLSNIYRNIFVFSKGHWKHNIVCKLKDTSHIIKYTVRNWEYFEKKELLTDLSMDKKLQWFYFSCY